MSSPGEHAREGRTAIGSPQRFLLVVSAVMLVGYLGIAYGVHHAFPFYIFDMFDMPPATSASRLLVRGSDGRVSDVNDHDGWACPQPVLPPADEQMRLCGGTFLWSNSRDGDALRWIDGHAGQGKQPVEIIRRIWTLGDGDAHFRDCVVQRCQVNAGEAP